MSSSFRNRAWSAGYFGKGGWRGEQLHKDCSSLQNSKVNRQPFPQHSSLAHLYSNQHILENDASSGPLEASIELATELAECPLSTLILGDGVKDGLGLR